MSAKRRAIAAVFVLFVCAVGVGQADEPERLQFADGLYSRGMFALAIKEYEAFLRDQPDHAKADVARFRLAECYRNQGDPNAAEKQFRDVFVRHPSSAYRFKAGYRRAEIFMASGRWQEAAELYRSVLKEGPPPDIGAACVYFLGDCLAKLEQWAESVRVFERVTAEHGGTVFRDYALLRLGEILGRTATGKIAAGAGSNVVDRAGSLQRALACYARVLESKGSDRMTAEALFQMAELHFAGKSFGKSAELYRRLLAEHPKDTRAAEVPLQSAWAAHNAGLFADALRQADEAIARGGAGGQEGEWLYLKANCERQLVKHDRAVATYEDILKNHPGSAFANAARYEQALSYHKMGKFEQAIRMGKEVQATPELRKDLYWLLAESHFAAKQPDDAVQYYQLIAKEFPASDVAPDAIYRLGHHLQERGKYAEAAGQYRMLVDRFPKDALAPQALFAAAFCLSKEDRHEESIRDWSELLKRYPSDGLAEEAIYRKAMGEVRIRRDREAQDSFLLLLNRFPASKFAADARYWQGMLLLQGGKAAEAVLQFQESLKRSPNPGLADDVKFSLGLALKSAGRLDESVQALSALLGTPAETRFPPALLRWMSEFAFEKKKWEDAARAGEALTRVAPDAAWRQAGWCLAGRGRFSGGRTNEAAEAFGRALGEKVVTEFAAESALRSGDLRGARRDWEGASAFYAQAAEWAGDEAQVGVRARAYAGLGRAAGARSDFEAAARYFMSVSILYDDPDLVPACLAQAAEAFERLGRPQDRDRAIGELKTRYPASAEARALGQTKERPDVPAVKGGAHP